MSQDVAQHPVVPDALVDALPPEAFEYEDTLPPEAFVFEGEAEDGERHDGVDAAAAVDGGAAGRGPGTTALLALLALGATGGILLLALALAPAAFGAVLPATCG